MNKGNQQVFIIGKNGITNTSISSVHISAKSHGLNPDTAKLQLVLLE
jgi:hypothetical protein